MATQTEIDAGRRDALKTMGAGALAASVGASLFGSAATQAATSPSGTARGKTAGGPYNILFILNDQERYFRPGELPMLCRAFSASGLQGNGQNRW